jgi:hypothetical protein
MGNILGRNEWLNISFDHLNFGDIDQAAYEASRTEIEEEAYDQMVFKGFQPHDPESSFDHLLQFANEEGQNLQADELPVPTKRDANSYSEIAFAEQANRSWKYDDNAFQDAYETAEQGVVPLAQMLLEQEETDLALYTTVHNHGQALGYGTLHLAFSEENDRTAIQLPEEMIGHFIPLVTDKIHIRPSFHDEEVDAHAASLHQTATGAGGSRNNPQTSSPARATEPNDRMYS